MKIHAIPIALLAAALAFGCGDETPEEAVGPERVAADKILERDPYMGVSCPEPNRFACDRVGLAVWLREPAVRVHATIADRALELADREWSGPASSGGERRMFAGFLRPAGLIDGPLRVRADDGHGRWIGRDPVSAPVELEIERADGTTVTTRLEVHLSPGWG